MYIYLHNHTHDNPKIALLSFQLMSWSSRRLRNLSRVTQLTDMRARSWPHDTCLQSSCSYSLHWSYFQVHSFFFFFMCNCQYRNVTQSLKQWEKARLIQVCRECNRGVSVLHWLSAASIGQPRRFWAGWRTECVPHPGCLRHVGS